MDPRFHDLPPLCSISLLRQLKELGKSNYSPDYWLIIKGSNSGTGGWQRCKGKGKVLPRISKWLLLWISMSSPTQKLSEPCLCGLLWKFHYIHVLSWFVCPLCVCVCVWAYTQLLSHIWLLVTPWTVACQAPLSMGLAQQEYRSGLPLPPPGHRPDPGTELASPASPALAGATWEAFVCPMIPLKETHLLPLPPSALWSRGADIPSAPRVCVTQAWPNRTLCLPPTSSLWSHEGLREPIRAKESPSWDWLGLKGIEKMG